MEIVSFLGWLSVVQSRRIAYNLLLPDIPSLAKLLQLSNTFHWSKECLEEVESLGLASGLTYKEYVLRISNPNAVPGNSLMNPIVIDDEPPNKERKSDSLICQAGSSFTSENASSAGCSIPGFVEESVDECESGDSGSGESTQSKFERWYRKLKHKLPPAVL